MLVSLCGFIKRNIPHFLSLGIPLLIIPFLYFEQLIDPVLTPKFLAFAGFLIIYSIFLLHSRIKLQRAQWPIINNLFVKLFFGYFIISVLSLVYSVNPSEGFFEVAKIGLFLLYLILILVQYGETENLLQWLAKYLILFSSLIGVLGLFQYFNIVFFHDFSHSRSYDITATFAHKNLYSQVLLLSIPFALYGAFVFKAFWRVLGIFSILLSLLLVILILSRASWIALFSAGFLTTSLWIIIEGPKNGYITILKKNIKQVGYIISMLLIVISLSIFAYSTLDTFDTLKKQVVSLGKLDHSSNKDRLSLWGKSIQLAMENPLLGSGIGSWKIQIQKMGTGDMKSLDGRTFFQRPHNDFLLILCEMGVNGLVVYFILFLVAIKYILVVLKKGKERNMLLFAYLAFFWLVEYFVFSIFSFPKERYEQCLLHCLIVSPVIINYYNLRSGKKTIFTSVSFMGCAVLGFLILAFSVVVGYSRFKSEFSTKLAFKARANSNWGQVIEKINIAESSLYQLDPTSTPLRWYSGEAHFNLNNLNAALKDFLKAYNIHPYHIHVLNNLASTYVLMAQKEKAIKIYNEAIAINPLFGEAHLNKAIVYYNDDEIENAYKSLRFINKLSDDYRHASLLLRILEPKITDLSGNISEQLLKTTIYRIQNDVEWIFNIYFKSVNNNRPFEHQLILDAIYILEIEDKVISRDEASQLQSLYVLAFGWR